MSLAERESPTGAAAARPTDRTKITEPPPGPIVDRLAVHCLAFAVMLIVLAPFLHLSGSYSSDDGAYAIQVHQLVHGHWDFSWKGSLLDPGGRWFPLSNSSQANGHWYAYIQHPLWPAVMAVAVRAFGATAGLHVLPMLGALGLAIATWLLASELCPRRRALAFWVAATGPVMANATLLLAHTVSAALAGFALVAAVRIHRRGWSWPRGAALTALIAAGVLVRAEGLVWAGALALTFVGVAVVRRRVAHGVAAATVAGAAAVAVWAQQRWIAAVAGGAYSDPGLRSNGGNFVVTRFSAAYRELLGGGTGDVHAGLLGAVALVLAAAGGATCLRRSPEERRAGPWLLLGSAAVLAVRLVVNGGEPMPGLLAVWPLVTAGLCAAGVAAATGRRGRDGDGTVGLVLGTAAIFTAAIIATQYGGGGGVEWGGRFFFPLLAPAAVLAVSGLDGVLDRTRVQARKVVIVAMVALAVVPTIAGLRSVAVLRDRVEKVADKVQLTGATVAVTTEPALPRLVWSTDPRVTWFVVADAELDEVLTRLHAASVSCVALVVGGAQPAARSGYRLDSADPRTTALRVLVAHADGQNSASPIGAGAGRLGGCPTGL